MRISLRRIGQSGARIPALLLFPVALCAQLYTGSLTGTVLDPSDKPIANAGVTLHDVGHNVRIAASTNAAGRYVFRSLRPGDYELEIVSNGFESFIRSGIAIDVGADLSADAKLKLAARRDTVQVHTTAPTVQTENATMGLVLDAREIEELPLVTRNPFDLAFLAPGVSQAIGTTYGNGASTPGFITNFVSDGSRSAQADVLLDGVSVTNRDNNPGVQKALYVPSVEAIEEYKIQQTNFSAEFGNSSGTIVNVITRSGTNEYHGELFEFLRNNDLNANSFFASAAGLAQSHLTRNDFGGTIGGPIRKNKTFFVFDFNGIRALTGQTSNIAGVPDAAERTANFGELCGRVGGTFDQSGICSNPGGQIYDPYTGKPNAENNASGRAPIPFDNLATYISPGNPAIPFGLGNLPPVPGNLIDPVGAKFINAFPLPNLNVGSPAYNPYGNFVATGSSPLSQQSFDIRLDQHFSEKDTASVRFSHEWDSGQNANFFGSVYDTNRNGKEFVNVGIPPSGGLPPQSRMQALVILKDHDGNVWVGTDSRGLLRLNAHGVTSFSTSEGASPQALTALFEGREGCIWIGHADGMERLRDSAFVTYSNAEGLPTDGSNPVFVDLTSRLWFPPVTGGLWWSEDSERGQVTADGLKDDIVYALDGGPGELWVGRQRGGLARLALNGPSIAVRTWTHADGLVQDSVASVYRARDGTVWAGTLSAGVSRLRDGRFTNFTEADGLASNSVSAILESADGTMWFGLGVLAAIVAGIVALYRLRLRQATKRINLRFQERLAERTRIAQELHDTLLQGFLSASMQVHVAADRLPEDSAVKPTLNRALELMGQVIEEGRNAVRGLRSTRSASLDLEQSFARIQQEIAGSDPDSERVEFRVVVDGERRPLHPVLRDEVYRIGREAVINAFRHARAGKIEMELRYSAKNLTLMVRDDGRGIDPNVLKTGRDGHFGLMGMRERADRIGAQFHVMSSASAGTEIELSIPGKIVFQNGKVK